MFEQQDFFNADLSQHFARKVTKLRWHGAEIREEIKVWQNGAHPNLILVLGQSSYLDFLFIDMELYTCNLSQYLDDSSRILGILGKVKLLEKRGLHVHPRRNPLPPQEVFSIILQLVNGIAFLHSRSITYQNLKPENGIALNDHRLKRVVLYCKLENSWKIADYPNDLNSDGRSKRTGQTHSGHSVSYIAPELLENRPEDETTNKASITNKVDIWSLGCLLYELASSGKAFPTITAIRKYCKGELDLPPPSGIGEFGQKIFPKMLQPNPSARPSANELISFFSSMNLPETDSRDSVDERRLVATPQSEHFEETPQPSIPAANPNPTRELALHPYDNNSDPQAIKDRDTRQFSGRQKGMFSKVQHAFEKVFKRRS